MSELWESAVEDCAQLELEQEPEVHESEMQESETRETDAQHAPPALTVSTDDFAALEERILRAVTLVKQERKARIEAEERIAQAQAQVQEHTSRMEKMQAEMGAMQSELGALKVERDHVRQRVDRLLQQLDAIEL